jgi:predicted glycosyltransferase
MGITRSTQPVICFYIHHHGSGHIMRAISIAGAIKDLPVCFMGSNLQPYADLIGEEIECVHLPFDLPVSTDAEHAAADLDFLHYAPLGLEGVRGRTAVMTAYFQRKFPIILVVDVSVEDSCHRDAATWQTG